MTLTLDLTPAEEERLRREASRRGQEVTDYARTVLLPPQEADLPAPGESLAEALQGYIGVVDSKGQYNFSEDTGKHFADGLLEKRRQGRL